MQFARQTQKEITSKHQSVHSAPATTYGLFFGIQQKQQFLGNWGSTEKQQQCCHRLFTLSVKRQLCAIPRNLQRARQFFRGKNTADKVLSSPPAKKSSVGRRNKCSSVIPFKKSHLNSCETH